MLASSLSLSGYNRGSVSRTQFERIARSPTRPTWVEVSLDKLRQNFRLVQQHVGAGITVCAVVKADAYGHGAVRCAGALQEAGVTWFGVTSTDEGILLRDGGIRGRILLMSGFWRGEEEELIHRNLTPAVFERWQIESLEGVAARLGVSPCPVHLKVDTGMSRLGVSLSDLGAMCKQIKQSSHLSLEGVASHFASADIVDSPDVELQLDRYKQAQQMIEKSGLSPHYLHMANSAGVVVCPQSWKNMVRPGICLYGYYLPFQRRKALGREVTPVPVEPILSWKTRILSLKTVPAGQALGYGGTYTTQRPSRIAVLPVGYADGLSRLLSSRGQVIVRSAYAPIVGLISMDLTLIDVTDIPGIEIGDEVLLLGSSGSIGVTALDHARLASTVPYEILCGISQRVPRRYGD